MVLNLSLRTKHDVNAEAEIARDQAAGAGVGRMVGPERRGHADLRRLWMDGPGRRGRAGLCRYKASPGRRGRLQRGQQVLPVKEQAGGLVA